jgi:hypothetical protein
LAIVAALRAVMAEPLPPPHATDAPLFVETAEPTEPVAAPEPTAPVAPAPPVAPALMDAPAVIDLRSDPVVDEAGGDFEIWDDEADEGDVETHSVPPLETLGSMSKAASLALFGHA